VTVLRWHAYQLAAIFGLRANVKLESAQISNHTMLAYMPADSNNWAKGKCKIGELSGKSPCFAGMHTSWQQLLG
jgi:hypothetical protein